MAAHFCHEGVLGLWERHPAPPARLQFTLLAKDGVSLEGLVTVPGEMVLVLLLRRRGDQGKETRILPDIRGCMEALED